MTYVKYKSKDYAQWQLLAGISAVAVSLQLKPWEGAEFPSLSGWEYFIGTLEKRTGDVVTAKERVLVSARATDTLTFTRSFWGDTAIAFDADDYFCLHVNSDIIIDIQDEVTRLETDKLNGAGWLRTALTNRRTYYSNGSWAETALALWSNWTYLKSNGASSAPTWEAPPLDINSQSTISPATGDFIPFYDISWTVNGKATTQTLFNLFIATNSQASAWSSTTEVVNPLQLKKYFGNRPSAGTNYTAATAWSSSIDYWSYTQVKIGTVAIWWTYTVWFDLSAWSLTGAFWRIYKNWVAFGTERTVSATTWSFSESLAFAEWDTISFWWYRSWSASTTLSNITVKYNLISPNDFTIS